MSFCNLVLLNLSVPLAISVEILGGPLIICNFPSQILSEILNLVTLFYSGHMIIVFLMGGQMLRHGLTIVAMRSARP